MNSNKHQPKDVKKDPLKLQVQKPQQKSVQVTTQPNIKIEKKSDQKTSILQINKKTNSENVVKKETPAPLKINLATPVNKGKPISIEKRKDNQAKLNISFPKPMYIYTESQIMEFKKAIFSKNIKIVDDKVVEMHSLFRRFQLVNRRSSKNRKNQKFRVTKEVIRDELQKEKHYITKELNKLTMDNFTDIVDELTKEEKINQDDKSFTEQYMKTFAKCIQEQVEIQPLFANMYSLFVQSILGVLNIENYDAIRTNFVDFLIENCRKSLEENLSLPKAANQASFIGFLTMRKVLEPKFAFDIATKIINEKPIVPVHIDVLRLLLIPSGCILEEKIPESKAIFEKLQKLTSKDAGLPGLIRFPLIDLLDARKNNWNIKDLINELFTRKSAQKNVSLAASVVQPKKDSVQKTITVANNKFAGLDSDDEYDEPEVEEEPFDGEQMVREYFVDNEISSSWNKAHTEQLLLAIVQGRKKENSKILTLFQKLQDKDQFDNKLANEGLIKVVKECNNEEFIEKYPESLSICGSIFGRFVKIGVSEIDSYPNVFNFYNIDVLTSFFNEIKNNKSSFQKIRESPFWMSYKWAPLGVCSQNEIVNMLLDLESEAIIELFPLYDYMSQLEDLVSDEKQNISEIKNIINQEYPTNIIEMPEFAIGITEFLYNEEYLFGENSIKIVSSVLEPLKVNAKEILIWIEKESFNKMMEAQEIAKLLIAIKEAAKFEINSYLVEIKDDEKHNELIQIIKNLQK